VPQRQNSENLKRGGRGLTSRVGGWGKKGGVPGAWGKDHRISLQLGHLYAILQNNCTANKKRRDRGYTVAHGPDGRRTFGEGAGNTQKLEEGGTIIAQGLSG